MPVTAKLSRKFYEQFGDDLAGELVDWFNAVDLTYQTQLKETNELNWERFKATLQAECAAIRGGLNAGLADVRAELRAGLADVRAELHAGIADLRAEFVAALSNGSGEQRSEVGKLRIEMEKLRTEMGQMRAELMRWMFVYWTGTVVTLGGLIVGMAMFGRR